MARNAWMALVGLLVVASGAMAEELPAGSWKFSFLGRDQRGRQVIQSPWIVQIEKKDGKWAGNITVSSPGVPKSTLDGFNVAGDKLTFKVKIADGPEFDFQGNIIKDQTKKILGSFSLAGQVVPAMLEATTLKTLDPYELDKETILNSEIGPEQFEIAQRLLDQAAEKKAKPEEVRKLADRVHKAAASYGPRWQRDVGRRIAESLANQQGFEPVAVEYARQTERLLDPADEAATQLRVLDLLGGVLRKAGKADDAKEVDGRIAKLVGKDQEEYVKKMMTYKIDPYPGRKSGDRVVLVELFTGVQCPPCVAADLAFDGLVKTYKPTEVQLLEYHLHIPRPDPLSNTDSEARADYYGDQVEGTPTVFFDGSPKAPGGGDVEDAKDKYKAFCDVINPLLDKTTPVKLKVAAVKKGDKIEITADASGIEKPGDKVKLRLALVEEVVRYQGTNGIRYHHRVVRSMPGGAAGMALKDKTGKQTVTVDLNDVRTELTKYLDAFAKKNPFPSSHRPLDLKNLAIVAFVQDDANKEVLQSAETEIKE